MDHHLNRAKKEVDELGQGFVQRLTKDVAGGMAGGVRGAFGKGRKQRKQAEADAATKAADERERAREQREQERQQERASKATAAEHMGAASKFGGAKVTVHHQQPEYRDSATAHAAAPLY